jgi:hypothetical protein
VSGTITLSKKALSVRNPYLTIAGESAPGGGIAIRNGPRQLRPSLEVFAHDVIIRHLRVRPGPHAAIACCSGALGLYGAGATDIIVDHLSASWGSDETIDTEDASNVTFQWMIVGEPLLNGGPSKRNRARNMYATKGSNITVHHSLFALGKFRNPQFQLDDQSSAIEVVNNVMYSPVWEYVISFSNRRGKVLANVVGNYKIAGTRSKDDHLVYLFEQSNREMEVYLSANYDETYRPNEEMPDENVIDESFRHYLVKEPVPVPEPVVATRASVAYADVLLKAGATRPVRDAVDSRYVEAVRSRSGTFVRTNPEEVGGWPVLSSGNAVDDLDADGMADDWERRFDLNPANPYDGRQDRDGDGWTNLEEYLHELAGDGVGMRPRKDMGHVIQ